MLACQQMVAGRASFENVWLTINLPDPKQVIDRAPSLLRELDLDWTASFTLANGRAVESVAFRGEVCGSRTDEIATAKLVVHPEVEQREIARLARKLEVSAYRPNVPRLQRRLRAGVTNLVPWSPEQFWIIRFVEMQHGPLL